MKRNANNTNYKMKKLLTIFLSALFLVSYSQNVNISIKTKEKVYSGTDFIVNVSVRKQNLNELGRFLMEIPSGLTPSEKVSQNGQFQFDGKTLKITWLKMPSDTLFDISFALKVAPNVEGYKVLQANLSYLAPSGKKTVSAKPQIVTILKGDVIETGDNISVDYQYIKKKGVSCLRQKPFLNSENKAVVNLLVNKGDLIQFGKIQEQIPVGYKAENLSSNGAIFIYNKNKRQVKFLWMNLPSQKQFIVSYLLFPVEGHLNDKIPFIITGEFTYAEGKTTKIVKVNEQDVDLEKLMQKPELKTENAN